MTDQRLAVGKLAELRTDIMEMIAAGMDDGLDPGQITDNILMTISLAASPASEVREALEDISNIINMLADPCDASDFDDSEEKALRATIWDAIKSLQELSAALSPTPDKGGKGEHQTIQAYPVNAHKR